MKIENRPENGGTQPQVVAQQGFSRRRLLGLVGLSTLAVACDQGKPPSVASATGAPKDSGAMAAASAGEATKRQKEIEDAVAKALKERDDKAASAAIAKQNQAQTGQQPATPDTHGGSGITGFEKQRPPWVDLERKWLKGQEAEVAKTYGRDSDQKPWAISSKNPANWEIDKEGGAMLKPVSQGIPFEYKISTDGAVAEIWHEVEQHPANTQFRALVEILPPDTETTIRGGTFWHFGRKNIQGAMAQVKWDVTQKELVGRNGLPPEQPGVPIQEVCPPGVPVPGK